MSNKNYDLELPISYNSAYKHYIPTYTAKAPIMYHKLMSGGDYWSCHYYISFDDGGETEMGYSFSSDSSGWAINANTLWWYEDSYKSTR